MSYLPPTEELSACVRCCLWDTHLPAAGISVAACLSNSIKRPMAIIRVDEAIVAAEPDPGRGMPDALLIVSASFWAATPRDDRVDAVVGALRGIQPIGTKNHLGRVQFKIN